MFSYKGCKLCTHRCVCVGTISTSFTEEQVSRNLRIQVCSNEGFRPFPKGDHNEILKIHWQILKIFFSRTTEPISTKLGINHLWVKSLKFVQMKGPALFQGEIISKLQKYIDKFKKSSSPEPLGQFQLNLAQIIFG